MFTNADLKQLETQGIARDEAERQLRLLLHASPRIRLDRPCTLDDGIIRLDPSRDAPLLDLAARAADAGRITKFVPASGAATRMFRDVDSPTFFERLDDFPFAEELRQRANIHGEVETGEQRRRILQTLLEDMRYAELPKALIAFHRVNGRVRTAFEDHLLEGAQYSRSRDGVSRTHFTVAPEFGAEFKHVLERIRPDVERATGAQLDVSFSEQHPSTDTLSITPDGELFRAADGSLLLRPAGHGALIRNLHALAGDIVVIKNIDNIKPAEASADVVLWKRLLIGHLLTVLEEVTDDRPVRVCGVVRNEGEPGGAPFWVRGSDGGASVQIIESSQVDLDDPEQRRIFESSTHFNPVDVVCAVRTRDGKPYHLPSFVDSSAVFLARKTHDGRELIALERPGLWNGAMAYWQTVFVEVPGTTFAPVKTVFDLLRPQHQSL